MVLGGLAHCFKPYYKWITFNTLEAGNPGKSRRQVLNLIINGLPSILKEDKDKLIVRLKRF